MRPLLRRGNRKLGHNILTWSLPAVTTCPGRTTLCESVCYALRGHYVRQSVRRFLSRNYRIAQRPTFAARMLSEIVRRKPSIVRIHVAGDFFSAPYIADWTAIARQCSDTTFFAYTRSWRVPHLLDNLEQLGQLPNMRLWYSVDAETGPLTIFHPDRTAVLVRPNETPLSAALVFRTHPARAVPTKRIGLAIVCPVESGLPAAKRLSCTTCQLCYR